MRRLCCLAAVTSLALAAVNASAAVVTFDFQDGTDQGWGGAFGADADIAFPVDNIGGSLRMRVTNTANFQEADPECALDCVPNEARELPVEVAMNNAYAFGGNNASVLFRRCEAAL